MTKKSLLMGLFLPYLWTTVVVVAAPGIGSSLKRRAVVFTELAWPRRPPRRRQRRTASSSRLQRVVFRTTTVVGVAAHRVRSGRPTKQLAHQVRTW